MGKLMVNSCPRCDKGEVFIDRDHYGWYECCLQCGYTRDLPDVILRLRVNRPGQPLVTVPSTKARSSSKRKRSLRQVK